MHLHNFCSVTAVLIQPWPPSSQRLTSDSSAARIKQKVKVPAFPLSLPPFNSELKVQLWPLQIVSCEGIRAVGVFSFFFPFFFYSPQEFTCQRLLKSAVTQRALWVALPQNHWIRNSSSTLCGPFEGKCYLFILGLSSSPSPKSWGKKLRGCNVSQ